MLFLQRFRKNVPRNMRPLVEEEDEKGSTPESRRWVEGRGSRGVVGVTGGVDGSVGGGEETYSCCLP